LGVDLLNPGLLWVLLFFNRGNFILLIFLLPKRSHPLDCFVNVILFPVASSELER
jgi:hypothetical protein